MRILVAILIALSMASCSSISPLYQFYAHKHAVPMIGGKYLDIPEDSPQQSEVFDHAYDPAIPAAMSILEFHRRAISSPGISAAVAVNGKLIWAGTSGWSDIETRTPLSTTSQFRIGSTSKPLTATLLAKLVDAGELQLDVPIAKYDVGQLNTLWHDITPRQLASHTAGLPHYKDNTDMRGLYQTMALKRHYGNVRDAVEIFDTSDTLFPPGDAFSYSSLGTVLLSAVIQEAVGMPFQQAMEQRVFAPLGMTHTRPEPEVDNRRSETPDLVSFYWHPEDKQKRVKLWRDVDLSHRLAGGGFISTSSDLVRLGLGFLDKEFVTLSTRETFWTPQTLNNGEVNEQGYGIGWRVRHSDFGEGLGSLFHANHGGVSRGAQSWLMVLPQHKMVVAVNINAKTEHFWDFGKVSFDLVSHFLRAAESPAE